MTVQESTPDYRLREPTLVNANKSQTENILLVNPSLHSVEEVEAYQKELEQQLIELGVVNPYNAWYLCTTYGKRANTILERASYFASGTIEERLIRAELWYCINFEMTNSLADFFVRRTGRLYFNIESITQHLDIIIKDFVRSLDWDDNRIAEEKNLLNQLLADATTYYETEF